MKKRIMILICMLLAVSLIVGCAAGNENTSTEKGETENKEKMPIIIDENCLIDLHLHLDGSISVASARELAKMCSVELPSDDDELAELLMCPEDCKDLNDYLSRFDLPVQLMQTEETIETSAYNLCEELIENGTIYAEIRFAPQKHCENGLTQEQVIKAAIRGIKKSELDAQLILCCMREGYNNSVENLETVRLAKEFLGKGVCACDLAGAEALYGNENYAYIFEEANELGLPLTIHSGEAAGAESVKMAIDYGAKRIGHGIRSIEDSEVVRLLADKKIALEVCPTSNINTCVFDKIRDMPIIDLIDNGVIITINSDNMSVSNTNVRKELQHISDSFNLTKSVIKQLLLNSANSSFADTELKKELCSRIENEFAGTVQE